MLGGLGQTLLAIRDGPNFTRQTHLAENNHVARYDSVAITRHNSQQQGKVCTRLQYFDAAHYIRKYVLVTDLETTMTVQHCQQHG